MEHSVQPRQVHFLSGLCRRRRSKAVWAALAEGPQLGFPTGPLTGQWPWASVSSSTSRGEVGLDPGLLTVKKPAPQRG